MEYIEITAVNGVRNDVDPERFAPGDLMYAKNVDIDESGKATRRAGTQMVFPGPAHSVWSDGQRGFFVQADRLKWFLPDGTSGLVSAVSGERVRYVAVNDAVFWTDGANTGVWRFGENEKWGITPPDAVAGRNCPGNLPAGAYLCTMTYVDAQGRESGAPVATSVIVGIARPENTEGLDRSFGGVALSGLPVSDDTRVVGKRIYISPAGETPLAVGDIPNTTTSFYYTHGVGGAPVRTQFLTPPPPGRVLGYYNGRLYVASGAFLMYSQPFEYELFDLRSDFIAFDSEIQTFAAVTDGIFLGTRTRTVFLQGSTPEAFLMRPVSPHGTVLGTEQVVSADVFGTGESDQGALVEGSSALWMSHRGLVVGASGGKVRDLTAKRFVPPSAASGAAFLKRRNGTPLYVISLFK